MSSLQRLIKAAKAFSEWEGLQVPLAFLPWLIGPGVLGALIIGVLISLPGAVVMWIGFQVAGKTGAGVALLCLGVLLYVDNHISTKKRHESLRRLKYDHYDHLAFKQPPERSTPVLVSGGQMWTSIAASRHTMGISTSGAAYVWGRRNEDQWGDGTWLGDTFSPPPTPVLVSGGHTWASISAGIAHTVGITTSGAAYAWGANIYGQLGDGTTTDRSTPVLLGSRP
jgi:alpha-tubulin suppressor-like RCC1 family protein